MTDRVLNSGLGMRDLSAENHWRKLEFAEFEITKPTLICMGGNGTTNTIDENGKIHKGSKKANYVCALAERMVGLKRDCVDDFSSYHYVDFLSFHYGRDDLEKTFGQFSEEEVEKIVDNMLLPLCLDKSSDEKILLPFEQACKNMSLITWFTHCHGNIELGNIMSLLDKKLQELGYTAEQNKKLFSNMRNISYSPLTAPVWVPMIRIDSMGDSFRYGLGRTFRQVYGHELNGVEVKYDKARWFRGAPCLWNYHEVVSIYTSGLLSLGYDGEIPEDKDEHTPNFLDRNDKWESVAGTKNADAVSKLVSYALSRNLATALSNYSTALRMGVEVKDLPNEVFEEKLCLKDLQTELMHVLSAYSQKDLERNK